MEEIIGHVSGVVLPILLCVLVGYGLALLKLPFDKKFVGMLISNVGYPTLIVSHLAKQHVVFGAFLEMMLAAAAAVACFGLIGLGLLALLRLPMRAYLTPMMLANTGNIGLPVCMLAFGDQGLAYAMAFLIVVFVCIFTIGMWVPMGKVTLRDVVRQPVIYAVILAIGLLATGTKLPEPIDHTVTILGGLTIPLMLLTLGYTLATLNVGELRRGGILSVLHLAMAASVAFGLVHLFAFEGTARGVFILLCLMPVSVSTYLWIELYDPEEAPGVAGFVLVSTLLTVIVLPLVLTFWI